jgi:hypothetical protein
MWSEAVSKKEDEDVDKIFGDRIIYAWAEARKKVIAEAITYADPPTSNPTREGARKVLYPIPITYPSN